MTCGGTAVPAPGRRAGPVTGAAGRRWRQASRVRAAASPWPGCGHPARRPTAPARRPRTARASAVPPPTTGSGGTATSVSVPRPLACPWGGHCVACPQGWAPCLWGAEWGGLRACGVRGRVGTRSHTHWAQGRVGHKAGWAPCLWGPRQGGHLVPCPLGAGQGGLHAHWVQSGVGIMPVGHGAGWAPDPIPRGVQSRVGTLSHILRGGWSSRVPQNPPHGTAGRTLAPCHPWRGAGTAGCRCPCPLPDPPCPQAAPRRCPCTPSAAPPARATRS